METGNKGHRALRRGRWSQAGQVYLVTATTCRRKRVFESFDRACAASRAMHAFDMSGDATLLAWVLMPDHAHWLLQLGCTGTLSEAINRLKATSARNANRAHASAGTAVWARGFHDRALRRDEDLHDAARYIIANPVRAGLVARARDYPFWNCVYL